MCNTFISGSTGKVGRILVEKILEDVDLKLAGGSASRDSNYLGKDLGSLIGKDNLNINIIKDISEANDIDLIIDFSRPQHSIKALRFATKENIPIVIGTTGFNETELNEINEISKEIPLLIAPNTSLGMALFKKILDHSQEVINIASSLEIHELHHKEKKDKPSGTAINIKKQLNGIASNKEIQIESIREGNSPGAHTLKMSFEDETIEISHKSTDRSIFAKGAIIAGKWLKDKPPGLYTMQDIYS